MFPAGQKAIAAGPRCAAGNRFLIPCMAVVIPPFFCAQGERRRQSSIDSNEAHANRCGACLMLTRLDDYRRENGCQASLRSSQIERAQVCPGMSINAETVHAGWS